MFKEPQRSVEELNADELLALDHAEAALAEAEGRFLEIVLDQSLKLCVLAWKKLIDVTRKTPLKLEIVFFRMNIIWQQLFDEVLKVLFHFLKHGPFSISFLNIIFSPKTIHLQIYLSKLNNKIRSKFFQIIN